jgi:hypothetical protein
MPNNIITEEMLKRLSEISTPHMKAINEAVEEAFPDIDPDATYTAALGFQLSVLLHSFSDPEERAAVVGLINPLIEKLGYRLVEVDANQGSKQ